MRKIYEGILAPPKILSKELLESIVDLIEWSTPEAIRLTEERVKEADQGNSWMSWKKVKRLAKKAK